MTVHKSFDVSLNSFRDTPEVLVCCKIIPDGKGASAGCVVDDLRCFPEAFLRFPKCEHKDTCVLYKPRIGEWMGFQSFDPVIPHNVIRHEIRAGKMAQATKRRELEPSRALMKA